MTRVACFSIEGLALCNSSDHIPPHFHAEKAGEWEVRVHFLLARDEMFELKWARNHRGPSSSELRKIERAVVPNRDRLLIEWTQKVAGKSP